ncbi:MAG: T9SS type A sorting domain-containing protein [Armatimonadetes bacterium]|nr:T9SS type A sorting domain-containing protein [Armatimonadota bacterium]
MATSTIVAQWHRVGVDMYGVAMRGSIILTVGAYGEMLRSSDKGATWQLPNSGTRKNLYSVALFTEEEGIAIGDSGTVIRTNDGGMMWKPVPSLSGKQNYYTVVAASESTGYIIAADGGIMRTNNRGLDWERVATIPQRVIRRVAFPSPRLGFIIGDSGRVYKSSDSGTIWSIVHQDTNQRWIGVAFSDSVYGFICSEQGVVMRTTNSGETWISCSPLPASTVPVNLAMADPTTVIVISGFVTSAKNTILARTVDSGKTWVASTPQTIAATAPMYLLDIAIDSSGVVIAGGTLGTVAQSKDVGKTWSAISNAIITIPNYGDARMINVAFADKDTGVIPNTLFNAAWLRSTDRGITWKYYGWVYATNFLKAHFFDTKTGIMAGDNNYYEFYRTTNAGNSWESFNVKIDRDYHRLWDFRFITPLLGFFSADALLYKTTDGGLTWKSTSLNWPSLIGNIFIISEKTLFCFGSRADADRIYRSDDSGKTWQPILETIGDERRISGFYFIDKHHGFVTGRHSAVGPSQKEGILYRTTDGGKTWDSTITEDGILVDIQFFNPALGYAVGNHASIYVTTDSGKTWKSERAWPYNFSTDKNVDFLNIELLPDQRTVIITGYGVILRREFPERLSNVDAPTTTTTDMELQVFPSITHWGDQVRITVSGTNTSSITLRVMDVLGQEVLNVDGQIKRSAFGWEGILETSTLSSGTYFITATVNNRTVSHKIIVHK